MQSHHECALPFYRYIVKKVTTAKLPSLSGTQQEAQTQAVLKVFVQLIVDSARNAVERPNRHNCEAQVTHPAIDGNVWPDRRTNEAAEECLKARQFHNDALQNYSETFRNKCWLQHQAEISTADGTEEGRVPQRHEHWLETETTRKVQT